MRKMLLRATAIRLALLWALIWPFFIKYRLAISRIAVLEFRIAWKKGRVRVLKPKLTFSCGIRMRKATARGMAMDTMTIAPVRLRLPFGGVSPGEEEIDWLINGY
jgi:hypothetical protein